MESLVEYAARTLAGAYVAFGIGLFVSSVWCLHVLVLIVLAWRAWRRPRAAFPWGPRDALALQVFYGLINPIFYLIVFNGSGPARPWTTLDAWMHAAAWTLLLAIWGSRLLLPRELESRPVATRRLRRLCILGLICIAAFALNDLVTLWGPTVSGPNRELAYALFTLIAMGPLYVIPFLMLSRFRARLAEDGTHADFLLMPRRTTSRLAVALATITLVTVAASMFRPSDAAARARVDRLAPAIQQAAARYRVDPTLVAAIVYVSKREVGPFRDQLERFATTMFLFDANSDFALGKWFDLSIGAAQIKPVTALTALNVCTSSGQQWPLFRQHLRDVPTLGQEWRTGPHLLEACQPPLTPVPERKPAVVSALQQDESNVAFAALILALYQSQWRDANPAWDISARPEILATLYQIGFARSRPHGAPRSSDFGNRVAEVSRAAWLQQRFGRSGQFARHGATR
jgi:hypothetical protein